MKKNMILCKVENYKFFTVLYFKLVYDKWMQVDNQCVNEACMNRMCMKVVSNLVVGECSVRSLIAYTPPLDQPLSVIKRQGLCPAFMSWLSLNKNKSHLFPHFLTFLKELYFRWGSDHSFIKGKGIDTYAKLEELL